MEEKERKIAEEEAMNKLVKEILKNGDVKINLVIERVKKFIEQNLLFLFCNLIPI